MSYIGEFQSQALNPPYEENGYLIFPNSVLSPTIVSDCSDSIEGLCYNLNLSECMEKCSKSNDCVTGMHYKIDNTNICAPLTDTKYNDRILINPVERLRKKSIYPWLKNTTTNFFMNKEINQQKSIPKTENISFPPNDSAALYAKDIISLNSYDNRYISLKEVKNDAQVFASKQLLEKSNFEIIPINAHSNLLLPYVPITYNLPIIIRIPGTNLTLSQKDGKVIEKEKPVSFLLQTTNPIVLAYSEEKNHIRYKLIKYNDPTSTGKVYKDDFFYIKTEDDKVLFINDNNQLAITNKDKSKNTSTFTFKTQMTVYYCGKDNTCNPIPWEKTTKKGNNLYYEDQRAYWSKGCYGLCKIDSNTLTDEQESSNSNSSSRIWMICLISIFFVVAVIIITLLFVYRK